MSTKSPILLHRVAFCLMSMAVAWACAASAQGDGSEHYERGVDLLEEARRQREQERRDELLVDAENAFRSFLDNCPKDVRVSSAHTQLGNILVERARMRMTQGESASADDMVEARRMYERAYAIFQTVRTELQTALRELANSDASHRDRITTTNRLRGEYLQAQLLMAAVLEESADTFNSDTARRRDALEKAANEYNEIYRKYRTRLAGLYARLYQGRCQLKRGQCENALGFIVELLEMPDSPEVFRSLKTKTLNLALQCWLDDSQKNYQEAARRGNEWLKEGVELQLESPDWVELRFHLARAHQLLAESSDDKRQAAEHRDKAIELAKFVARRESPFRKQARSLLKDVGGEEVEENLERD